MYIFKLLDSLTREIEIEILFIKILTASNICLELTRIITNINYKSRYLYRLIDRDIYRERESEKRKRRK